MHALVALVALVVGIGTPFAFTTCTWCLPLPHRNEECAKNHIDYFVDRGGAGPKGHIACTHFKTGKKKGPQCLPMPPNLVMMFGQLDKVLASFWPKSTTYFFSKQGGHAYERKYFSTICGNLLVFDGTRLTTNALRHLFVTGWRDFMHHPSTFMVSQHIDELTQAASTMMLNSPEVWRSYDDTTSDRAMQGAIALWPKFQAFMEKQHLDQASRQPWDPLSADFATLEII